MRFRKGLMQKAARGTGYLPTVDEDLNMYDWVQSSGGQFFENAINQMVSDDAKSAHLLEIMYGSAVHSRVHGRCL